MVYVVIFHVNGSLLKIAQGLLCSFKTSHKVQHNEDLIFQNELLATQ